MSPLSYPPHSPDEGLHGTWRVEDERLWYTPARGAERVWHLHGVRAVHLGRRARKRQPTVFTCTLTFESGEIVEIGRSGGFGSSILPGYGAFVVGLHEALVAHRDAIAFRAGMSGWMLALNVLVFVALAALGAFVAIPLLTMFAVMDLAIFANGDTTTAAILAVSTVVFLGAAAILFVVPIGVVMWISRPVTYQPDALPSFYVPSDR